MATTEEIRAKLADIISEYTGTSADDVQLDKSFTEDLGVDSLARVEIFMDVEKEFGVEIPEEEAKNISTVGDAVAYIEANS